NRTVKRLYADDSADSRVKVGNRQAPLAKNPRPKGGGFCISAMENHLRLEKAHVIHPVYLARWPDLSAAILQSNLAPKRNHAI
ncbi:hypothetical protein, partial [Burkholderia cepacia]|uniref:hypothetical protein n=1 Tax=Burkholderia cepacia TaxID=292 RepID=UPI000AEF6A88